MLSAWLLEEPPPVAAPIACSWDWRTLGCPPGCKVLLPGACKRCREGAYFQYKSLIYTVGSRFYLAETIIMVVEAVALSVKHSNQLQLKL
eukprot:scaffold1841_cov61-Phaeocystis_antarctica.AAC.1